MKMWRTLWTPPSNTQVYSPLGSFIVEQHDTTERRDAIKQHYESDTYGWEKGVAITWTLLLAGLLVGSIYNRLGETGFSAYIACGGSDKWHIDRAFIFQFSTAASG